MKLTYALAALFSLAACGVDVQATPLDDQGSVEQAASAPRAPTPEYPGVEAFFARESFELALRKPAPTIDERPVAIALTSGVALSLRLENVPLPANGGIVTLRPITFSGGAVALEDMQGASAVPVSASQVAHVLNDTKQYRHLCGFKSGLGGAMVHGTIAVTYGGSTYPVQAEIVTSEQTLAGESPTAACSDRLCISLPDKHCRDTEFAAGSCVAVKCGLTLGDLISWADLKGINIPAWVIGGGVDKVAEWLGKKGHLIGGTCRPVSVWLIGISLGCQCVYL